MKKNFEEIFGMSYHAMKYYIKAMWDFLNYYKPDKMDIEQAIQDFEKIYSDKVNFRRAINYLSGKKITKDDPNSRVKRKLKVDIFKFVEIMKVLYYGYYDLFCQTLILLTPKAVKMDAESAFKLQLKEVKDEVEEYILPLLTPYFTPIINWDYKIKDGYSLRSYRYKIAKVLREHNLITDDEMSYVGACYLRKLINLPCRVIRGVKNEKTNAVNS
ncbi:MAG: hypothetical protein ACO2O4_00555 [Minisyncoccia bacterium]|jgi:hypothetical protein